MTTSDNPTFLAAMTPLWHQLGAGALSEADFMTAAEPVLDAWGGSDLLSNRALSKLIVDTMGRVQNTLMLPIIIEGSAGPGERVFTQFITASGILSPSICGGRVLNLPTETWVLTLKKWSATGGGFVDWGTVTVSTAGVVAVSIPDPQLIAGDLLAGFAPATQDATFANFFGALTGSDVL
jgi:hypothetical protein